MGLFHDNDDKPHVCSVQSLAENSTVHVAGNLTFFQLSKILSGSFTAATYVIILTLMIMHSLRMRRPNEQIKIMKICSVIPVYSLVSFISVCYPSAAVYLSPWQEFYESLALGYFFLLMCEYIAPSEQQRDVFFSALKVPQKKSPSLDGIEWYRKRWIAIFQYPLVSLGAAVATDITQAAGVYCESSNKLYFAHLWIEIISALSLTVCIISILVFYSTLKTHLAGHRTMLKLLAFKTLIGLTFLERIIFLILTSTKALQPTSTLTYADTTIGIPAMIICMQTTIFAVLFHYAYSVTPYSLSTLRKETLMPNREGGKPIIHSYDPLSAPPSHDQQIQGGRSISAGRAWLAVWDPREIIGAIKFIFTMHSEARMGSSFDADGQGLEPLSAGRNRY